MGNLTIAPLSPHTHTVIFLHNTISSASELASKFQQLTASSTLTLPQTFPTIKWVFPQARIEETRLVPPQWFQTKLSILPGGEQILENEGFNASLKDILDIIDEEAHILQSHKGIFLAGVGMGCAIGISALIQSANELAGFIGMSGWLTVTRELEEIGNEEPRRIRRALRRLKKTFYHKVMDGDEEKSMGFESLRTPVFLAHARDNDEVPLLGGLEMAEGLAALLARSSLDGVRVDFKCYESGGHWIDHRRGVDDIVGFIGEVTGLGGFLLRMQHIDPRRVSCEKEEEVMIGEEEEEEEEEEVVVKEEVLVKHEEEVNSKVTVWELDARTIRDLEYLGILTDSQSP
ncbi:hypothetical protein DSL72_006381 [Monilinia vaccinii-corymbosi]|uniref:Phospholipase/carboxylesterase/thioesterase domain-containing protein n=1 Tax=Monilinia vaccinii-corymbosi TaxID=61207 RepID=A0A8A3PNP4_9HELO|nr:hypothetical protein DSL72_006381 [Monilinia vaccinii-corymbosi]